MSWLKVKANQMEEQTELKSPSSLGYPQVDNNKGHFKKNH